MKKCYILFLVLISFSAFSQIKGTVIDEFGNPIPYVNIWVDGESIGTTSNEDGSFLLNYEGQKMIIFSAIGYESKKVNPKDLNKLLLKFKIQNLDTVVIQKRLGKKKIEIGKFNKGKINRFVSSTLKPLIIATKINGDENAKMYPFIKEIRFLTTSHLKEAKINLRFFEVLKDGSPGVDVLEKNILVTVKEGTNVNSLILSDYNLILPEDGIFVAFEWLIIQDNLWEVEFKKNANLINKKTWTNYEPSLGMITSPTQNTFFFLGGNWQKSQKISEPENNSLSSVINHWQIAVSLKLTN